MREKAVVTFIREDNGLAAELEIPTDITANDLIMALNEVFDLGMDVDNIFRCCFAAEHPVAFLHGNRILSDLGVRDGTVIRRASQER
ncbi:MAG: EsaB/YukD family protein [Clostridiales bacterium]|nr:EsaB/YukD family protein [Clostridiales bacterium]